MNRWLVKEEPSHYAFDRLVRDGQTSWTGVRNPLAQKHLRAFRKGDEVLYYHTGDEKAVVGIARAAGDAYPDPAADDGAAFTVDLVPVKALNVPVRLSAVKADPFFADFALARMPRLSVMPVTEAQWYRLLSMAGQGR
jgi:predicted RNA-binding protein with PUA-like domain